MKKSLEDVHLDIQSIEFYLSHYEIPQIPSSYCTVLVRGKYLIEIMNMWIQHRAGLRPLNPHWLRLLIYFNSIRQAFKQRLNIAHKMDLEALKLVRLFFCWFNHLLCEGQRYALQSKCLLEISGCTPPKILRKNKDKR